jgi:prenyltransferase beta subunit
LPEESSATSATRSAAAGPLGDWLAANLTAGDHAVTVAGDEPLDDAGLSIDVAWALTSVGGHETEVAAIGRWLADPAHMDAYTGQAGGEIYAGAAAKAALAFQTAGIAAGLTDGEGQSKAAELAAVVEGRIQSDGRVSDESSYGDYSTPFSQALAVIALVKQARDVGGEEGPVAYLAASACPKGGFPAMFAGAGEIDGPEAECVTDIDATALALQALALAGGYDAALEANLAWLLSLQQPDGSWGLEGPSVNSTGLAVSTLAALVGSDAALDREAATAAAQLGVAWLEGVQNADGGLPIDASGDSDLRASAQGALGLLGVGIGNLTG